MDWHRDGTCVSRHLYQNGHEIDAKNDVCTWKYKLIAEHDFEVDYQSKLLGNEFPKQLIFKIISSTRMRNTKIGYDAFRIICPVQEITIRRSDLGALQEQAAADRGNLAHQVDLAGGYDKLGAAMAHRAILQMLLSNSTPSSTLARISKHANPAIRSGSKKRHERPNRSATCNSRRRRLSTRPATPLRVSDKSPRRLRPIRRAWQFASS